jgi:imidazolonepropionase-like amidohydrolase
MMDGGRLSAIRGTRLFDGERLNDGPVLVLVDHGRITDVDFTGAAPPAGAAFVDLGDVTLMPGFVDAHTHLVWDPNGQPEALATTPDDVLLDRARQHARQALHAGVTTVRDLGDRNFVTVTVSNECRADPSAGADILTAGPAITRTDGHCWYLGSVADTSKDLAEAVKLRSERGTHWVKIMATGGFLTAASDPFVPQYTVEQLTVVVQTARRYHLPVTAHAHSSGGIANAAEAGVDGVEHCTFQTPQGPVLDQAIIDTMVAKGIWAGITIGRAQPGPHMPPALVGMLEQRWTGIRNLVSSGVKFAFSTDAGINATKTHDVLPLELTYAAAQGLSNAVVLAAATSQAAASCHLADRKGHIKPGHDADILAIPGNPMHTIDAILEPRAIFRLGQRIR